MQNSTPPATSNISPLQELWVKEYENSSTPFDIEEPDAWIAALAKSGKIHGEVLDAGCGPGRNSIYLAGLGCNMLGVDISAHAVGRARQKASSKNSSARFLQANLCQLSGYEDHFDAVVDIGCFHSLDQRDRAGATAQGRRAGPDGGDDRGPPGRRGGRGRGGRRVIELRDSADGGERQREQRQIERPAGGGETRDHRGVGMHHSLDIGSQLIHRQVHGDFGGAFGAP